MAGSLFITPALAFLSGPSTLQALSDTMATTQEYDASLTNSSAADLEQVLSRFTALTGSEYAQQYSLEKDLVALRTAKQSADEEMETLMKGALVSLSKHLTLMSNGSPLVLGAALTILQDEASLDDEGFIYFQRFPRVKPARFPKKLTPELHDVEDTTDPGEALKTKIPANLSTEDYRETLDIATPTEAISIFTDSLQTPARRILALKYWYFSLDGDIQMQADTAKALLDIVLQEEEGDFQEFTIIVLNNLLAGEFKIWILFYLRRLMEKLPAQPMLPLLKQFGGALYRHSNLLKEQFQGQLHYGETVDWLLQFFQEYPPKIREESFYLWSFLVEGHFEKGREIVHEKLKQVARDENDIGLLWGIIERHIWIGPPLPMKMAREIIDIVCRRTDLSGEQRDAFQLLLRHDRILVDAPEKSRNRFLAWLLDRFEKLIHSPPA